MIDQCDFLHLNPFLYRFIQWSSRNDQSKKSFPKIFRFADQDIFINSSFRLILNYRQIDRHRLCPIELFSSNVFFLEWSNILVKNRLIDMSLSRKRLENDLWLRLVQMKCQGNFLQQIRSNQRNSLIAFNERLERQVRGMIVNCFTLFVLLGKSDRYSSNKRKSNDRFRRIVKDFRRF